MNRVSGFLRDAVLSTDGSFSGLFHEDKDPSPPRYPVPFLDLEAMTCGNEHADVGVPYVHEARANAFILLSIAVEEDGDMISTNSEVLSLKDECVSYLETGGLVTVREAEAFSACFVEVEDSHAFFPC